MATAPKTPEVSSEKGKRLRSPAYPFISLGTALRRAREFYDKEGRNSAFLRVAASHWGYEPKSSGGLQTAAAMMSFGLMQDEGTGDKRKLKLTQNALRILLDGRPDSPQRVALIKQAATTPKIHAQLWKRWGATLPSNENLKHTLMFDWEPPFNENTVDGFIKEFRDTIAFAKLSESDTVASEVEDNGDSEDETPYTAQIGDWVQWERGNGDLGFPEPKRVKGISPDGNWVYVDGQNGCAPRAEMIRAAAPETPPKPDLPPNLHFSSPPKTGMQEMVVPLANGTTRAVFQWPTSLSKEDVEDLKDSLKMLERKITRPSVESLQGKSE
jgi:hypothetical protein